MKNIEVEIRGEITKSEFEKLMKLFTEKGKFIDDKNRIAVCYPDPDTGSLVEECYTDIRVRETNSIPEIIIKKGRWGGNENRKELSVVGKKGEFAKMLEMMDALGHKEGMAVVRKGKVFEYKGIEFSLVEVPGHSYYYEAELMVEEAKIDSAQKKIRKICNELGLDVFDDDGFFAYINKLNKEANKPFAFKNFDKSFFEEF